ncbi:MAG: amidase [Myxococcota bacterium]|nr:amidase [Myxococcota bacterium]
MDSSFLHTISARALAGAIRGRELSAREAVDACLARIEAVNPRLNAVVALRAEAARAEAEAADAALARGEARGPLHGLPVTIKDSFDSAGLVSTWGTPGRAGFVPDRDATVVARLRAAGAIVLGKTNTPEFTMGFETDNPIYGRTCNPYAAERSPGGSSGGAAAILAAGGSPLDLGTDTGGSIRMPAHACGITGIRPTTGRVPRTGHAIGPGSAIDALTQVGPMARRVEDLAWVLPILAGPDGLDPFVAPVPLGDPDAVELGRLRAVFHVDNGLASPSPPVVAAVERTAKALDAAGVRIEERRPPAIEETQEIFAPLILDAGSALRLLAERCGTAPEDSSLRVLLEAPALDAELRARVIDRWDRFRVALLDFVQRVDLIVSPVNALPALPHGAVDENMMAFTYTMTHNLTGFPSAVVRAGSSPDGLPIGVQLVAAPWREDVALAAAAAVERALGGFEPPPEGGA